jgi:hypothetical protein
MAKRIVFHIGLHKTASTYIQRTLAANRAMLKRYDFDYPASGSKMPGHLRLQQLCAKPGAARENVLSHFYRKAAQSPNEAVILSSEWLSMADDEALERLAWTFRGFDISVVCFFRNQIERLQSFFSEDAKKFLAIGFDEWFELHKNDTHYFYDRLFESLRDDDVHETPRPMDSFRVR